MYIYIYTYTYTYILYLSIYIYMMHLSHVRGMLKCLGVAATTNNVFSRSDFTKRFGRHAFMLLLLLSRLPQVLVGLPVLLRTSLLPLLLVRVTFVGPIALVADTRTLAIPITSTATIAKALFTSTAMVVADAVPFDFCCDSNVRT